MGGCFHAAYNLEQVKAIPDMDFIVSSDLEFYQEMCKSAEKDTIEQDQERKQQKVNFIYLVVEELNSILQKLEHYNNNKETPNDVQLVKENYQNAINVINLFDDNKFKNHTKIIFEILEKGITSDKL